MEELVPGLKVFREHFAGQSGHYFLIGGAASLLVSDEQGLEFRATKDLDIVLCIEALHDSFLNSFWEFIRLGGYEYQGKGQGAGRYYRFMRPSDPAFPVMLELFSRVPDGVELTGESHLTPIPAGEEASSLSAILLDEVYYEWVLEGRRQIEGIPIVGAEHLIPLKASAFLDLSRRRDSGEKVDSRNVKKHLRDVVRLARLLTGEAVVGAPDVVRRDIQAFIDAFPVGFDFAQVVADHMDQETLFDVLRESYLS